MTFACPCVGDVALKKLCEDKKWECNFHGYVLEDDPVPGITTYMGDLKGLVEMATPFLNAYLGSPTTVHPNFFLHEFQCQ